MTINSIKKKLKNSTVKFRSWFKKHTKVKTSYVPQIIVSSKRELTKKNVYQKFLGSLIKEGNVNAAKRHLDSAFINVAEIHQSSLRYEFTKIFSKLACRLEMKTVKMRRNTHNIPFPIRSTRQDFLKIK